MSTIIIKSHKESENRPFVEGKETVKSAKDTPKYQADIKILFWRPVQAPKRRPLYSFDKRCVFHFN